MYLHIVFGYNLNTFDVPAGINSTLEDWRTFLTQTLTGALAAPHDLFRKVKLQTCTICF